MESLKGELREKKTTHYQKSRRRKGKVPGVLYGAKVKNYLFEIGELELNRELNRVGEYGTLNIEIDNQQHKAMIKELQKDAVTHKVLHIDLEEVSDGQVVQTEIPILFEGEEWIAKGGGIVQKERSAIKVQGKINEIPKNITIDLPEIAAHRVCRVGDIELGKEISILDDINTVIASITKYNNMPTSSEEE